jgi:hypothetical protein
MPRFRFRDKPAPLYPPAPRKQEDVKVNFVVDHAVTLRDRLAHLNSQMHEFWRKKS